MKLLLLVASIFCLSIGQSEAQSDLPDATTDTLVARIFSQDIHLSSIQPSEKELSQYQTLFPDSSPIARLAKLRQNKLSDLIWSPINDAFEKQHNIKATEAEVASFKATMSRLSPKSRSADEIPFTPEDQRQIDAFNKAWVENWKKSKALYETFGGVVIFQQGNPLEPVGAYRSLLEQHRNRGDFEIYDKELKDAFWSYFLRKHPFEVPLEDIDFSIPWWEKAQLSRSQ